VRDRIVLTGDVPTPIDRPSGCHFRTRCYKVQDVCATARPALEPVAGGDHRVACYFPETLKSTGAGGDRLQRK
jgi:oligopeptide/dipeptide ABC transporter ATP-binding protein